MTSFLPPLAWRAKRMLKKIGHRACARVYRDDHPDVRRAMVVAGAGRSGTTWAVDLLRSELPLREMFEPFHPFLVPEYGGYQYFQYMRPDRDDPRLEAFCRRLLQGEIRNAWIDRRVWSLRPEWRAVKTIRGLLLLRWLRVRFPEVPMVLVVRHPCAVVASRLRLEWATDTDIEPFLAQPELLEDHLAPHLDLIRSAQTPEEKHAIVWSISNLVPIRQFPPGELELVFYERLVASPSEEVPHLFGAVGQPFGERVFRHLRTPSGTVGSFSAVVRGRDPLTAWHEYLGEERADRVRRMVGAFGLDHLYGEDDHPRPGARRGTLPGGDPERSGGTG